MIILGSGFASEYTMILKLKFPNVPGLPTEVLADTVFTLAVLPLELARLSLFNMLLVQSAHLSTKYLVCAKRLLGSGDRAVGTRHPDAASRLTRNRWPITRGPTQA